MVSWNAWPRWRAKVGMLRARYSKISTESRPTQPATQWQ